MKTNSLNRQMPGRASSEIFVNQGGGITIEQSSLEEPTSRVCFHIDDIPTLIGHLQHLANEIKTMGTPNEAS